MKAKLDIRVRINLADYGAFEELLSEQIKDPDIRELTIVYGEIDDKATKPAKVDKPVKTKKKFTKTAVTATAIMAVRTMKQNYPNMSHMEIRRTIEAQTGKHYGLSTISEILGGTKYNNKLDKVQLKAHPPLKKRFSKKESK